MRHCNFDSKQINPSLTAPSPVWVTSSKNLAFETSCSQIAGSPVGKFKASQYGARALDNIMLIIYQVCEPSIGPYIQFPYQSSDVTHHVGPVDIEYYGGDATIYYKEKNTTEMLVEHPTGESDVGC